MTNQQFSKSAMVVNNQSVTFNPMNNPISTIIKLTGNNPTVSAFVASPRADIAFKLTDPQPFVVRCGVLPVQSEQQQSQAVNDAVYGG